MAIMKERNPDARIIWCQEEPANMGSWVWIEPFLRPLLGEVHYAGREAAASQHRAPCHASNMSRKNCSKQRFLRHNIHPT